MLTYQFLYILKSKQIFWKGILNYAPSLKDLGPCSGWVVCLSVLLSRFMKNGNIFGINSDRRFKLAPLVYLLMNHISLVTISPRIEVGVNK